jgi:hypothetical protein
LTVCHPSDALIGGATKLRTGSLVLVVVFLAGQLSADAEQAGPVYRVGYLQTAVHFHQAFERVLSELAMDIIAGSRCLLTVFSSLG